MHMMPYDLAASWALMEPQGSGGTYPHFFENMGAVICPNLHRNNGGGWMFHGYSTVQKVVNNSEKLAKLVPLQMSDF